jgi:ATP-dependent Lhr-like helicase
MADDKRGAHLALAPLAWTTWLKAGGKAPQRIGLSATRHRNGCAVPGTDGGCHRHDHGHRRAMDLAVGTEGRAWPVAERMWQEIYDRLTVLINDHRTTPCS